MISSRQSAAAARARRARWFAAALLVALLALAFTWRAPLTDALWWALGPLMSVRYGSAALEAELASTTAALADRDALAQENEELKRRLGREVNVPRVLAGVILRPPATPYDTLTIDAGFKDGISRGDAVSAGGSAVIGEVTDLYANSARVTLYSAPGQSFEALLHLRGGASLPVVVEGQGGGSLRADVPAGSAVAKGDYAVLPGVFGGFVAQVSQVDVAQSESFSAVYFSLPVNPQQLRFVEVLKLPSHDIQ